MSAQDFTDEPRRCLGRRRHSGPRRHQRHRLHRDVESALVEFSAKAGLMSEAGARDFVAELKATGRYQADVY